MSRSPLDEHFGLAEEQGAETKLRRAVDLLNGSGVGYVIEGGWAVSAYGSPTPSVDLDVLMRHGEYERLQAYALTQDLQIDTAAARHHLGLDLSWSDEPNHLFRGNGLNYVPEDLLRNRIQHRTIQTVGGPLPLRVPTVEALIFMKFKAFHDCKACWELSRDSVALATLVPDDAREVKRETTAYWERKAGKDLYDLGVLFTLGKADDVRELFGDDALDRRILSAMRDLPLPLFEFAAQMAQRSRYRIRDPRQIQAWLRENRLLD